MENKGVLGRELIKIAQSARENSYARYSGFKVGAALLCKSGKIYTGCNVESVAFTPTCCAERTAFFKAVSEGERGFLSIAVVGGKETDNIGANCSPCGVCLQVMMEFCHPDKFEIFILNEKEEVRMFKLRELLPLGFAPHNLF